MRSVLQSCEAPLPLVQDHVSLKLRREYNPFLGSREFYRMVVCCQTNDFRQKHLGPEHPAHSPLLRHVRLTSIVKNASSSITRMTFQIITKPLSTHQLAQGDSAPHLPQQQLMLLRPSQLTAPSTMAPASVPSLLPSSFLDAAFVFALASSRALTRFASPR